MPSDLERLEVALEQAAAALSVVGLEHREDEFPCQLDPARVPQHLLYLARAAAQFVDAGLHWCEQQAVGRADVDSFINDVLGEAS